MLSPWKSPLWVSNTDTGDQFSVKSSPGAHIPDKRNKNHRRRRQANRVIKFYLPASKNFTSSDRKRKKQKKNGFIDRAPPIWANRLCPPSRLVVNQPGHVHR